LAYFVTHRASDINGRHTVMPAAMAMVMLAGAVVVADLGTAVVLMATAAAVFYVAGLEPKYFKIAAAVTTVLLMAAIVSKPYRLKRIVGFVDPVYKIVNMINPSGEIVRYMERAKVSGDPGYHARQSRIAVGSGGIFGQGLMKGNQKLFYLPEAHTDFIYAVVGEELGIFGSSLLLGGFVLILWRGFRLYWVALDDFGRYLAVGVTFSIIFQAFVNMTVVLDLGPTKGIPLPLISYGGSSLLSTMISLGLLLSVSERARP
jgi:cell division protein FtsW